MCVRPSISASSSTTRMVSESRAINPLFSHRGADRSLDGGQRRNRTNDSSLFRAENAYAHLVIIKWLGRMQHGRLAEIHPDMIEELRNNRAKVYGQAAFRGQH